MRSFEVDTPQTQAIKRDILAKAGIDATGVTFVAADFEQENWLARLVDAGFDPGTPALFLFEGVMMFLSREAVEDTLRKIASTAMDSGSRHSTTSPPSRSRRRSPIGGTAG